MKIEMIAPSELLAYERNSRTHPEWQIAQIVASIAEFGFCNPVLIGPDNVLIAGHGRVQAAMRLDLREIPAVRLVHLSDDQRRALVIADNKIAENAGWDEEMLRAELAALSEVSFDLDVLGFSDEELGAMLNLGDENPDHVPGILSDEDNIPDPPAIHTTRVGDVWMMGGHRLICGDSTSAADLEALCAGALVDGCWTDPPYNVDYEGTAGKIANDNMASGDFRRFLTTAFSIAWSVMREGAPIYVAHADTEGLNFRRAFSDAGFKLSGCLVWVKPSLVLGRSDYQWRHEPILYGWKLGAAHSWYGGRANTTVVEHDGHKIRAMPDGSVQIDMGDQVVVIEGEGLTMRSMDSSIIRFDKPARNGDHPTMKPVGLIRRFLENSQKKGDVILDVFGGSGSTLIACETVGMSARLVELEPKFCDVIVLRWQELTGKRAVRESDGIEFDAIRAKQVKGAA